MDGFRFTVIVVDGAAVDMGDCSTSSLKYRDLTWEQSVDLAKLSFLQGFELVIWQQSMDTD